MWQQIIVDIGQVFMDRAWCVFFSRIAHIHSSIDGGSGDIVEALLNNN